MTLALHKCAVPGNVSLADVDALAPQVPASCLVCAYD